MKRITFAVALASVVLLPGCDASGSWGLDDTKLLLQELSIVTGAAVQGLPPSAPVENPASSTLDW